MEGAKICAFTPHGGKIFPTMEEEILRFLKSQSGIWNNYLAATILGALYYEASDILHLFGWGDGKIIFRHRDSNVDKMVDINFASGAPFYPVYMLDEESVKRYEEEFGNCYATVSSVLLNETLDIETSSVLNSRMFYRKIIGASNIFKSVTLASDGVDTFHKKDNPNLVMNRHEYARHLTDYKSFAGAFVERRMLMFKKFCQKEGWQSYDDVSVATIAFE